MKILAVDDDPEFLALFENTLSNLGYSNVTYVASAAEALAKISNVQSPFECFILDIQMPDMNGIELCQAIRATPQHANTPIVMNTVMTDRGHIDQAFAAGATDYLTKPIDEIEINARLGVMHTLVLERIQLKRALENAGSDPFATPSYRFSDHIPMHQVSGTIEYIALKNYLKTLGMFRVLSTKALGIHVINGQQLYEEAGAAIFGEVMSDVAACIADCLKRHQRMFSYAGNGNFTCLVTRMANIDTYELAEQLRLSIAKLGYIYGELNINLPIVAVGPVVSCKVKHVMSPDRILETAIEDAQSSARHYSSYAQSFAI